MKSKKRAVTMIEMMIVILLIGIIGGVLAYNFKGSLDQGKEFKTVEGAERLHNILMFAVAQGEPIDTVVDKWPDYVKKSPLAGRPDQLMKDGWGETFEVTKKEGGDDISVVSRKGAAVSKKGSKKS